MNNKVFLADLHWLHPTEGGKNAYSNESKKVRSTCSCRWKIGSIR